MKQVIIKKGKAVLETVPVPLASNNTILVKTAYSCISAGTEISGVQSSKESLVQKAFRQPGKIKTVIERMQSQGIIKTLRQIQSNMAGGQATGYSISGVVIAVGADIHDLKKGDKVACAGAGFANHAEYAEIPRNLAVKIPSNLGLDQASTITLGAIALQGVRRADLKIGELAVVFGLGILGQITVELLKASGCKVIGIDLDNRRIEIARKKGIFAGINPQSCDCIKELMTLSSGYGADGVIITTATSSSEPLSLGFKMCRKKGKVVLVGTAGKEINRDDMYKNELDFLISTSYGPGRYDEKYENEGMDYPFGYVRWTENRNMQAYLDLLTTGRINIQDIIEKIYPVDEAEKAFQDFNSSHKPLIVLLKYDQKPAEEHLTKIVNPTLIPAGSSDRIKVALIGAGSFAKGMHLPNLLRLKDQYELQAVMSRNSYNAQKTAEQFNAGYAATDYSDILHDKYIDLVMICTRHELHTDLAIKALQAGKAVFLEKPMAINEEELDLLVKTIESTGLPFMVGFNRRFSSYAAEVKKHTDNRINPLFIHYRMNAGYLPYDHWAHQAGGRIIGEACHIIDLMGFWVNAPLQSVSAESLNPKTANYFSQDNKSILLKYEDGSLAVIDYFAVGSKELAKEYCEIHFDGKSIIIDDYRHLTGYNIKTAPLKSRNSEKGQNEELMAFYQAIKKGSNYPIPLTELIQTTQTSLAISRID